MTVMQSLPQPSATFRRIAAFTRELDYDEIPATVTRTAALLILDLIGVLAAAAKLGAARIARHHAARNWVAGEGAPSARLPFDGRHTSLPGLGFAMATQLDNLDAHDGWHASKGHAGVAIFPALCAFAEARASIPGREALLAMVLGYEVAYRAAAALHATVADYHTSGAWNALGCAAIGARLRGFDEDKFRHALGIAEYHGPRSQMMREIANPSMLHDGSGWGAPVGIMAVLLAEEGFQGAPAATVEFDDAAFAWTDLGQNWLTAQQYIKPYPICRWAHAPIDAALRLRREHGLMAEMIDQVEIATFVYSAELSDAVPISSPVAQYSLAWPVAAALARGRVGVDEVMEASFADREIVALTKRTHSIVDQGYEDAYPARRLASVSITLKDGRTLRSGTTEASGGPVPQPTDAEVIEKFRAFAGPVLGTTRASEIESAVIGLTAADSNFKAVLGLIAEPARP